MRSQIDWNEIYGLLPQKEKEDWLLRAVTILANSGADKPEPPEHVPVPRKRHANGNVRTYHRYWRDNEGKEGGLLARPGRRFKINKDRPCLRPDSRTGKVQIKLNESKNDFITTEGLRSLAKGQNLEGAALIAQMYSRGVIDIIPEEVTATMMPKGD
jgi:hypothetical protein